MSTQSPQSAPDSQPAPQRRGGAVRVVLIVAGFAVALAVGIVPRLDARAALEQQTEALAVPTVQITLPTVAPPDQTLVLPGDIEAYQQTPIFARTNGYLKAWYADIGTHVKAGQLLATIDAPEVDAELRQARADALQAQANDQFAGVTAIALAATGPDARGFAAGHRHEIERRPGEARGVPRGAIERGPPRADAVL